MEIRARKYEEFNTGIMSTDLKGKKLGDWNYEENVMTGIMRKML